MAWRGTDHAQPAAGFRRRAVAFPHHVIAEGGGAAEAVALRRQAAPGGGIGGLEAVEVKHHGLRRRQAQEAQHPLVGRPGGTLGQLQGGGRVAPGLPVDQRSPVGGLIVLVLELSAPVGGKLQHRAVRAAAGQVGVHRRELSGRRQGDAGLVAHRVIDGEQGRQPHHAGEQAPRVPLTPRFLRAGHGESRQDRQRQQ
jgi:hypothetical protein